MSEIIVDEKTANPNTPNTNERVLYAKSDGFYMIDDAGLVTKIAGATELNDLTDVDLSVLSDGQALVYNSTNGEWENTVVNDLHAIHDNVANEISALTEKTTRAKGDLFIVEDSENGYTKVKMQMKTVALFGCGFAEGFNDAADTNSLITPEEYLSIDSNACEAGKYRVGVTASWNMSTASRNIQITLKVDGTAIGLLELETKDTGADIRNWSTSFFYVDLLAGDHTISVEYNPEQAGDTARMYYAGLEFWRTS